MQINRKHILGRTGAQVSSIGLGAWALGGKSYGTTNSGEMVKLVERYIEMGGNHIDTAVAYGESEKIIGKALTLQGNRDKHFLASKVGSDGSKEHLKIVRKSLEESLKALNTDYIDLFYLHSPPEGYDAMNRLLELYGQFKEEGKIRFIGASVKGPNVTDETQKICRMYIEDGRTDVLQVIYSILRQDNCKIFELASENGVGIVARTVLESGILTGKFKKNQTFDKKDHRSRWGQAGINRIVAESEWLKNQLGSISYDSVSQMAIRFAMDNPFISTTIIGAKSIEQLECNSEVESLPPLPGEVIRLLQERYKDFGHKVNVE